MWSVQSRRSVPTNRFAIPFACGARIGVSTVSMPIPLAFAMKSPPYARSRSRMRKRGRRPQGVASITWRHTHAALGRAVTMMFLDAATVVRDEEQHVEGLEQCGRHREEVGGPDLLAVIGEEGLPPLRRRTAQRTEPVAARVSALTRSRGCVAHLGSGAHPSSGSPVTSGQSARAPPQESGASCPPARAIPAPIATPASAVPAHDGLGAHDNNRSAPARPPAREEAPEGTVAIADRRVPLVHRQLLAKREVLEQQVGTRTPRTTPARASRRQHPSLPPGKGRLDRGRQTVKLARREECGRTGREGARLGEEPLQFVRKVSGFRRPAAHNAEVFDSAVEEVAAATAAARLAADRRARHHEGELVLAAVT